MAFPTYDDAYNFYQRYACHAGFDIKKSRMHKAFREVCCTREGKHVSKVNNGDRQWRRPSKKMGCKAYVKLRHNYDGGALSSVVYDVVELQHNHPLTPSPSAVKHMRAHKNRDDTFMQFMDTMQESHVPQSCIMGVLFDLHGGQENIPFTSHDVENRWHILNRHSDPLNTIFARDAQIEPDMMLCINQTYTPYEFETSWDQFIKRYDLEGCPTMKALYDIRDKWVPAFSRKEYCERMTSTQRSESMNKLVKHKFVDHQTTLHRFARRILEVITDRKEKEAAETRAWSGKPVLAVRWPFVIQMSRLYTRAAFRLFEDAL
ncbi:protein FAR1-RELATED SEQUENCE 5-like [Oryza glaberrima]|nr:protein FAR1-RELATED SEQUENCE 5-like [Oryza glaberrima]